MANPVLLRIAKFEVSNNNAPQNILEVDIPALSINGNVYLCAQMIAMSATKVGMLINNVNGGEAYYGELTMSGSGESLQWYKVDIFSSGQLMHAAI